MKALASIVLILSLGVATAAGAGSTPGNGTMTLADAAMDSLKAAAGGGQKLHCSGAPGQKTCTSDYAWVCPSGWNACRLSGTAKTCCTQK